jgi:hypothetical protein
VRRAEAALSWRWIQSFAGRLGALEVIDWRAVRAGGVVVDQLLAENARTGWPRTRRRRLEASRAIVKRLLRSDPAARSSTRSTATRLQMLRELFGLDEAPAADRRRRRARLRQP